jgi:hypothetical protein
VVAVVVAGVEEAEVAWGLPPSFSKEHFHMVLILMGASHALRFFSLIRHL